MSGRTSEFRTETVATTLSHNSVSKTTHALLIFENYILTIFGNYALTVLGFYDGSFLKWTH